MTPRERVMSAIEGAVRDSGLTRAEFSRRCGLNECTISAYLTQRRIPRADVMIEIAEGTGRPVEFMVSLVEGPPTWPDPQKADAMDAVEPMAKSTYRAMAQLRDRPTEQLGKLHSAMAAVYLLAYEAGRVAGMAGGARWE